MTLVLRKAVQVAPLGLSGPIKTLPGGTAMDDIHPDELSQLCPSSHDHPYDGDNPSDCHFVEAES